MVATSNIRHRAIVIALIFATAMAMAQGLPMAADEATTGFVSGTAWLDLNRNRIQEPIEPPLSGYTVLLKRAGQFHLGEVIATATTAPDGTFALTGLQYGDYWLESSGLQSRLVVISEVRGATSLDLPVDGYQTFLPLSVR
jgi:hypothetical protein